MRAAGARGKARSASDRMVHAPRAARRPPRQSGISLIELIVAIAVIGIAAGGVLLVFAQTVIHSADPMVQQQALAVAEAYLDEILARPAADPDGSNAGETRSTYDDIGDYAALGTQSPPRDQNDVPLTELAGYSVAVTVAPNRSLGPPGETVPATRVDVRVTYPPVVDLTLTGYQAQ